MSRFIQPEDYDASIHKEILDALLRHDSETSDAAIVEICEDRAIEEMRGYLDKFYNTTAIFDATGAERNQLVLMMAVDIAVYHIFCQHNPYKISQVRKDRYDRAIEWLKAVAAGKVTIANAPRLDPEAAAAASPWQLRSNILHDTHV